MALSFQSPHLLTQLSHSLGPRTGVGDSRPQGTAHLGWARG